MQSEHLFVARLIISLVQTPTHTHTRSRIHIGTKQLLVLFIFQMFLECLGCYNTVFERNVGRVSAITLSSLNKSWTVKTKCEKDCHCLQVTSCPCVSVMMTRPD